MKENVFCKLQKYDSKIVILKSNVLKMEKSTAINQRFVELICAVDASDYANSMCNKYYEINQKHFDAINNLKVEAEELNSERRNLIRKIDKYINYGATITKFLNEARGLLFLLFFIMLIPYWIFIWNYSLAEMWSAEVSVIVCMGLVPLCCWAMVFNLPTLNKKSLSAAFSGILLGLFIWLGNALSDYKYYQGRLDGYDSSYMYDYYLEKMNNIYIPVVFCGIVFFLYVTLFVLISIKENGKKHEQLKQRLNPEESLDLQI